MSQDTGIKEFDIERVRKGQRTSLSDCLAKEEPLNIRLQSGNQDISVAITMRTPGRDSDLARGFLFTEGIIESDTLLHMQQSDPNRITLTLPDSFEVDWTRLRRHGYTSSSCGVCGKTSLEQVYASVPFPSLNKAQHISCQLLQSLPDKLLTAQLLFELTGGIHAAGLFNHTGDLLHFAEDVGRHNALDKLIGHFHKQQSLPLSNHILVLSGRASFELIQKAAMAGIQWVVAVGAPSSLAVELAIDQDICLCGFVRSNRLNIYSYPERVLE